MASTSAESTSTRSSPAAFELRGASVVYDGRAALRPADLVIRPGERVALVGPSGAGKTTLLRVLNAGVRPTAGAVLVGGRDLATLSPDELRHVRSTIGFVHQDLCLVPNLRVSQNVIAGQLGRRSLLGAARAMLWPRREDVDRAARILARVGIGDKLYQRTDTLSGGQRQRVAIARALFQDPLGILADEPVSAVDPARARDTVALLNDVARERGLTLIVSLHDIRLATEFFPRLVGLRDGAVVFDAPAGAVTRDALDELYALEGLERVPERGEDGPDR